MIDSTTLGYQSEKPLHLRQENENRFSVARDRLVEAIVMTGTNSFSSCMGRLQSGEGAAAQEVFDRFARRLIALAGRQFGGRLAGRIDAEDMVQSAFKSFFVRHRKGTLQLGDWDDVWSLLAIITLRKCVDQVDYLRAQRRDVRREVSASENGTPAWQLALDREPRPEEAVALSEALERLFKGISDDDRPILELSLQGYTAVEIGLRLGRALRSVQRLREQIRKRIEHDAREGLRVGG